MQNAYYPPLSAPQQQAFDIIVRLTRENPDYLDDSPYTPEFQALIRGLVAAGGTPMTAADYTALADDGDDLSIEIESERLYRQVKNFSSTLSNADVSEKAAMFRVSTQLLERLLTAKEKSSNIAHYEQFKMLVLDTVDRFLTPQQKSIFLDDLKRLEAK